MSDIKSLRAFFFLGGGGGGGGDRHIFKILQYYKGLI